ncbi:MAG: hypothetical protein AAFP84_16455 [Actinomycetota bacterium]
MRGSGVAIVATVIGAAGVWLVVSGWFDDRSLAAAMRRLRRPADEATSSNEPAEVPTLDRVGAGVHRLVEIELAPATRSALRTIDRRPDQHIGMLVATGLLGLVTPTFAALILRSAGVLDTAGLGGVAVPAGLSVLFAIVAPVVVHAAMLERATEIRVDLRHQMSAFVDMVTMLLAGNTGHEGALREAAHAGDGRLFRELRRRMREVSATGRSLIDALDLVADDFDLTELGQIAATGRLAASEGAPIARSLAAKCSTLRSTLAADQEAEARVRTEKITPPLVGMTVLFMAVIIYPALNL